MSRFPEVRPSHVEQPELFSIDKNNVSTSPETTEARPSNNDLVCSLLLPHGQ